MTRSRHHPDVALEPAAELPLSVFALWPLAAEQPAGSVLLGPMGELHGEPLLAERVHQRNEYQDSAKGIACAGLSLAQMDLVGGSSEAVLSVYRRGHSASNGSFAALARMRLW